MFCSRAFWDGFWSVFTFGYIPTRTQRCERILKDYLNDTSLPSCWQQVEQDLWKAMNQFEEQFGGKHFEKDETIHSSEEVLSRLERLQEEYDTPDVLVRCSNCQEERNVSKFHAQEAVRCRCGGYSVAVSTFVRCESDGATH
jgi:hypothetical protein